MTDEVLSSWLQIPTHILEEVALLMSMADRLHLTSVCKTWREKLLPSSRIWNETLDCHMHAMNTIADFDTWLIQRQQAQFSELRFFSKIADKYPESLLPLLIQTLRTSYLQSELIKVLECYCGDHEGWKPSAGKLNPGAMDSGWRGEDFVLRGNWLQRLHHLDHFECHCRSIDISLNSLPLSLESFSLRASHCAARLGPVLRNMKNLKRLEVNIINGFDTGIDFWSLTQLTHLGLGRTTDSLWAAGLCRLTNLRSLHLTRITNPTESVTSLSTLRKLTSFTLVESSINQLPACIVYLPNLARLELLSNTSLHLEPGDVNIWDVKEVHIDVRTLLSLIANEVFFIVDANNNSPIEFFFVHGIATIKEDDLGKVLDFLMDLVESKAGDIRITTILECGWISLDSSKFQRFSNILTKYPGAIKVDVL